MVNFWSSCCKEEPEKFTNRAVFPPVNDFGDQPNFTVAEDRSRQHEVQVLQERKWVAVTAYQPIDTVTKVVEVPVVKTVQKFVTKHQIEEKLVEVPKYITEYVDKHVEVPEIEYIDKLVEIPDHHHQFRYVPKVEERETIIERPVIQTRYVEKFVEVPEVKEIIRYEEREQVEEIIKYIPKGTRKQHGAADITGSTDMMGVSPVTNQIEKGPVAFDSPQSVIGSYRQDKMFSPHEMPQGFDTQQSYRSFQRPPSVLAPPFQQINLSGMQKAAFHARAGYFPSDTTTRSFQPNNPPSSYHPQSSETVSQVFVPKVVDNVEVQRHIPIAVDVPVPYMVPKPVIVPVQMPVLKFRDHFVPVPVRRRVIPRIRWSNEVYEVECIKEMPFLQIQDVIKPVPCDVEIKVHEFVEKTVPINPAELSQADVHAMWMRVNADLAEQKKAEMGPYYPSVKHPEGTVFGEPSEYPPQQDAQEEEPNSVGLHPGHPLAMTYLQNEWMKERTTETQKMYTNEFFAAHQKAAYNIAMQHPTQLHLNPEQLEATGV